MVDTIGLNDKTFVDNYRTLREKLHVTERWKLIDNGSMLEVSIRVEDPDTYYELWSAIQRLRRVQQQMREEVCAENNQHTASSGKQAGVLSRGLRQSLR